MIRKLVVSLLSALMLTAGASMSAIAAEKEKSDPNKEQFFSGAVVLVWAFCARW